jgi:hypothetical protein
MISPSCDFVKRSIDEESRGRCLFKIASLPVGSYITTTTTIIIIIIIITTSTTTIIIIVKANYLKYGEKDGDVIETKGNMLHLICYK